MRYNAIVEIKVKARRATRLFEIRHKNVLFMLVQGELHKSRKKCIDYGIKVSFLILFC